MRVVMRDFFVMPLALLGLAYMEMRRGYWDEAASCALMSIAVAWGFVSLPLVIYLAHFK